MQSSFEVVVGGDTYTFKVPTIKFDIEVGYKAADIRRRGFPEAGGGLGTVDYAVVQFSRHCAYLELYLTKATTLWPYGFETDDGSQIDMNKAPVVDFEKFPASCADIVVDVGAEFETQMQRFRRKRNTDKKPAGTEAVVSQ